MGQFFFSELLRLFIKLFINLFADDTRDYVFYIGHDLLILTKVIILYGFVRKSFELPITCLSSVTRMLKDYKISMLMTEEVTYFAF